MNKTTAPARADRPVPSQAKADEIREDAVRNDDELEAKPVAKPKKAPEPATEVPYPTQADCDAIKAGTYGNRELTSR